MALGIVRPDILGRSLPLRVGRSWGSAMLGGGEPEEAAEHRAFVPHRLDDVAGAVSDGACLSSTRLDVGPRALITASAPLRAVGDRGRVVEATLDDGGGSGGSG